MKRKRFCFRREAEQRALLAEAGMRGFHAAVKDFPGQKTPEQQHLLACADGDLLARDVCCTPDALTYGRLVISAWLAFYTAMPATVGERLMAHAKLHIGPMNAADGLAFLRQILADAGMAEVVADLYRRYQDGVREVGEGLV